MRINDNELRLPIQSIENFYINADKFVFHLQNQIPKLIYAQETEIETGKFSVSKKKRKVFSAFSNIVVRYYFNQRRELLELIFSRKQDILKVKISELTNCKRLQRKESIIMDSLKRIKKLASLSQLSNASNKSFDKKLEKLNYTLSQQSENGLEICKESNNLLHDLESTVLNHQEKVLIQTIDSAMGIKIESKEKLRNDVVFEIEEKRTELVKQNKRDNQEKWLQLQNELVLIKMEHSVKKTELKKSQKVRFLPELVEEELNKLDSKKPIVETVIQESSNLPIEKLDKEQTA